MFRVSTVYPIREFRENSRNLVYEAKIREISGKMKENLTNQGKFRENGKNRSMLNKLNRYPT